MLKGVISVDSAAIANGSEVANSDGVHVTSDGGAVPDRCVLGEEYTANQSGIWGNPCRLCRRNLIVEWEDLSMPRVLDMIGNIVVHSRSVPVHRYSFKSIYQKNSSDSYLPRPASLSILPTLYCVLCTAFVSIAAGLDMISMVMKMVK